MGSKTRWFNSLIFLGWWGFHHDPIQPKRLGIYSRITAWITWETWWVFRKEPNFQQRSVAARHPGHPYLVGHIGHTVLHRRPGKGGWWCSTWDVVYIKPWYICGISTINLPQLVSKRRISGCHQQYFNAYLCISFIDIPIISRFFCNSQECFICWDNWIKNRTILSNVPNGCGEEKVEPTTKCQAKKCLKVILVRCGQTARGQHVNVAPHLLSSPIVQTYWCPLKGKHWEGICSKMICPTKNSWKIPGPVRWKSRQSLGHQNFETYPPVN